MPFPEIHNPDQAFIAAKGQVLLGDKALIYRQDENTTNHPLELDLPGGAREEGETPFQTFQREVREEFGITILPENITYSRIYHSSTDPNQVGYWMVAKMDPKEAKNIRIGNEGSDHCLLTLDGYLERDDAWETHQERTKHHLDSLSIEGES